MWYVANHARMHDAVRVRCSNVMAPRPQETVAPTAASTAAVVDVGWMR
jgi:hypothetical protein